MTYKSLIIAVISVIVLTGTGCLSEERDSTKKEDPLDNPVMQPTPTDKTVTQEEPADSSKPNHSGTGEDITELDTEHEIIDTNKTSNELMKLNWNDGYWSNTHWQ